MNTVIESGFLLINKPVGMSSYGCIGFLKRIIKQKIKIGHAGTLDPFASGLLIVAFHRQATRLLSSIMTMEKTYIATGKCGELTDTLDCTGTVIATNNTIPSEQDLQKALAFFGSSYEQIPPIYSALKHEGNPLYALARNKQVDLEQLHIIAENKRRTVQLYEVQFLSYEPPYFTIQARVSHGTYIRTFINDIAECAGSCATTYQLARTVIGPFNLSQAAELTQINSIEDINQRIIPESILPV